MASLEQLIKKAEKSRYNMNGLGEHSDYMNLLFQIMDEDMDVGVAMWKDIIINYRFENRSQDFTYIALDKYLGKFGLENTLDLFKKDPELERLLFCESREISERFLALLIDFSTSKILNHYLNLIEKNTTDKMLRTSKKRKEYLVNQYSRLRASAGGFRLEPFIKHFSPTIDFVLKYYPSRATDKRILTYKEWEKIACIRWEEYNRSFDVDYYTPNVYMSQYVDIGIDWSKLRPAIQGEFIGDANIREKMLSVVFPVKDINDIIHNISVVRDTLNYCLKRYKIVSIAPDIGGKKSALMQFIARNSSAYFHFHSFFPSDDSSFTICCFSGTKRENVLFEIQQRCIHIDFISSAANEIVLGGVGLSHYLRYLKLDMNAGKYLETAGTSITPFCYSQDYCEEINQKIRYWKEFLGEKTFDKIMSTIVDVLLHPLEDVYETQLHYKAKYTSNQLRNSQEDLTKVMIDSGFFKTRWINEQKLYRLIQMSFSDSIYQFHPIWLGQQSLDIYIPSLEVAIEYQGQQHYEAIDFFGGEEGLMKRKVLDERKRKLCLENNVQLFTWPYTTPVDKPHVMKFIKDNLSII